MLVELVGHLHDGRAPASGTAAAVDVGGGVLDVTAEGVLTVPDVPHPLFVEGLGAQSGQHRVAGELTVTRVASALQMGAVRGVARVHIAEHGVEEGLVGPVEGLVVALKGGGGGQVGVDHLDSPGLGPADDLKAAEAVPRELGLDYPPRAVGGHQEPLTVVVGLVQAAVGKGLFGEENRYGLPRRGGNFQNGVARGVLPAVVDNAAVLTLSQLGNGQGLDQGVGGAVGGLVLGVQILGQGGVGPAAVVEIHPEAVGEGGVIVVLGLGEDVPRHKAVAHTAGLVRDEILGDALFLHRHAVDGLGETERTAVVGVPAAAEVDGDDILPLADVGGDIEMGHVDTVSRQHLLRGVTAGLEVRGQGEEGIGIDTDAVDVALEKAQTQDVQGHLAGGLRRKAAPQDREGVAGALILADPGGVAEEVRACHGMPPCVDGGIFPFYNISGEKSRG